MKLHLEWCLTPKSDRSRQICVDKCRIDRKRERESGMHHSEQSLVETRAVLVFISIGQVLIWKKMFFLVEIKQSREKIIIPSKWFHQIDLIKFLNYGPVYYRKHFFIAFHSRNSQDEPNFDRRVLTRFDGSKDACYAVKVIKSFGKEMPKFVYH